MNNIPQKSKLLLAIMVLLLSLLACIFVTWKTEKESITVGLVTTLTGPYSTAGSQTRNGAILAIDQANATGGINGRQIELIIKDDKANPEIALQVDKELIDAGVTAILGHYVSTVSIQTTPLMNEEHVVMLALSSTSSELTGLDDNFIRIAPSDDNRAPLMAELVYARLNLKRIAVVYDISNAKYTESFYNNFKTRFEMLGGKIASAIPFNPLKEFSVPGIIEEVIDSRPGGLLIITNAIDGAMICQHLRMKDSKIKVFDSGWAFTGPDFVLNGGPATEGVITLLAFDHESSSQAFISIKEEYENRFREPLRLYGQRGYEAAQVIIFALSQTSDPAKVKEAILRKKKFNSLNDSEIIIDEYGDSIRTLYVLEMRDGSMKTIGKVKPSDEKSTKE